MKSHPTRFSHPLSDGRIQCRLCPRGCVLKNGERGFCYGRQNIDGVLSLTTYGRASSLAVDPVEKKPLYHFYPGSGILSLGTIGCNLGCEFCQNWHISRSQEEIALRVKADPKDIARKAKEGGIPLVAFTYNEPIVFAEYVMDTAEACHEFGVKTVAVTAGYITQEACADFFSRMDAANVDLKAFRDDFYKRLCGASLKPVLDTLKFIREKTTTWLEITNLIVPGENDSPQEIKEMCAWIASELGNDVPLHFSAFHPDYKVQDKAWTPLETLKEARRIARKCGLKFVYTGNVRDEEGSSTYCPECGKVLIERAGFDVRKNALVSGGCPHCKVLLAGRWKKDEE